MTHIIVIQETKDGPKVTRYEDVRLYYIYDKEVLEEDIMDVIGEDKYEKLTKEQKERLIDVAESTTRQEMDISFGYIAEAIQDEYYSL